MNCNQRIKQTLAPTGLSVTQDEYTGKDQKYIVFTYEDEVPAEWGDNGVLADTVYIQLQLITPKNFNYFSLKHQIRNLLEGAGFLVTSIQSWLGDEYSGTEKVRQTVFELTYGESRTPIENQEE